MSQKRDDEAFNPFSDGILDLLVKAFEGRALASLPPEHVGKGPGVYGIFYAGGFEAYKPLAKRLGATPIYVGKAVIPGGRKGGGAKGAANQNYVTRRLAEHSRTILQARNLRPEDFKCRWLLVAPEFVNAAEAMLIDHYKPLWNCLISGFGIHVPGKGRMKQARSDWDMLHPGREFAMKLPAGNTVASIAARIAEHLQNPIPCPIEE